LKLTRVNDKCRILHICSDYSHQELYSNLVKSLQRKGFDQVVYVPVRSEKDFDKFSLNHLESTRIVYSLVWHAYYRVFFNLKIHKLYRDLKCHVQTSQINVIHAHLLFSTGAIALKLKKENGTPFIVAVRNTDVNIFFRYMVHLRKRGLKILQNADAIIFLTPAYVDTVFKKYIPESMHADLRKKVKIIPNGIHDFWIENRILQAKVKTDLFRILYVGDFSKNKNVISLISAVEDLNSLYGNFHLTIVGGGGNNHEKVLHRIKNSDSEAVSYLGRITNKQELIRIYRENDLFAMASFKETFGIVYLEAMTQGLPIVYSKGQGVDGYFDQYPVGCAVNPESVEDIKEKILDVREHRHEYSQNAINQVPSFSWDVISRDYQDLYTRLSDKNSKQKR